MRDVPALLFTSHKIAFPAKAGIRRSARSAVDKWVPAFAGNARKKSFVVTTSASLQKREEFVPGVPESGVLGGVRVLDFGRYIAGPFCAALLGDLGAEVIRIERLGGGEDRGFIPVGAGPEGGGAMFLAMNRNKRGMTLDPAAPKGREIVKKLVATADVVVANLPPAVLRSLALDLDSLRAVKPDIILTTVTGFGAGGPLSHKHGFDGIGQTMSGAVYLSGMLEQPIASKVPWVDFGTACLAAFGTLAALLERGKSGHGQKV